MQRIPGNNNSGFIYSKSNRRSNCSWDLKSYGIWSYQKYYWKVCFLSGYTVKKRWNCELRNAKDRWFKRKHSGTNQQNGKTVTVIAKY